MEQHLNFWLSNNRWLGFHFGVQCRYSWGDEKAKPNGYLWYSDFEIIILIGELSFSSLWNHPSLQPAQPRIYPPRFGAATVRMLPQLKSKGEGNPSLVGEPDGPSIFNNMSWNSDLDWSDARLRPLIVYLRGNKSLQLPERWKVTFPTKFWTLNSQNWIIEVATIVDRTRAWSFSNPPTMWLIGSFWLSWDFDCVPPELY